MDGRSTTLIAMLALASSALAGCIDAPGFLNADAEATALEHDDAAAAAAAEWHADAKLASIMTIETTESMDERIPNDPDVGNGRALVWWYGYYVETDAGKDFRVFRVTADGSVAAEEGTEMLAGISDHDEDVEHLPAVRTDSDAAIATAKTNESFRAAAQGFNATVLQGIGIVEGVAAWWIVATSADGLIVATIDDATGTLVSVTPLYAGFEIPDWTMDSASSLGAPSVEPIHLEGAGVLGGDRIDEYPFRLDVPMAGVLNLTAQATLPVDGVRWAIVDAMGEEVDAGAVRGFGGGAREIDVELHLPGDYTLVLARMAPMPLGVDDGVQYAFTLELEMGGVSRVDGR